MDKLAQVLGVLRALRSVATQSIYTDVYQGMEAQCISTYKKCVGILKTVKDYEEIESIAPELTDAASMKEIGFAVEMLLSIVRSEKEDNPMSRGFNFHIPRPPRPPRFHIHHRPGSRVIHTSTGCGPRRHDRTIHVELQDEMREKLEEEQERFEEQIEEFEDKIDELQEKMEEARERLQERLEDIREKYEDKMADLEEDDDADKDVDEPKTY